MGNRFRRRSLSSDRVHEDARKYCNLHTMPILLSSSHGHVAAFDVPQTSDTIPSVAVIRRPIVNRNGIVVVYFNTLL